MSERATTRPCLHPSTTRSPVKQEREDPADEQRNVNGAHSPPGVVLANEAPRHGLGAVAAVAAAPVRGIPRLDDREIPRGQDDAKHQRVAEADEVKPLGEEREVYFWELQHAIHTAHNTRQRG